MTKPIILRNYNALLALYRRAQRGKLKPDTIIHAYKYVKKCGLPPYQNYAHDTSGARLRYRVGYEYSESNYSTNRSDACGEGIHLATHTWCHNDGYSHHHKMLLVEITPEDIVCIPRGYGWGQPVGGKFRVKRMTVIAECDWNTGIPKE